MQQYVWECDHLDEIEAALKQQIHKDILDRFAFAGVLVLLAENHPDLIPVILGAACEKSKEQNGAGLDDKDLAIFDEVCTELSTAIMDGLK